MPNRYLTIKWIGSSPSFSSLHKNPATFRMADACETILKSHFHISTNQISEQRKPMQVSRLSLPFRYMEMGWKIIKWQFC